MGFPSEFIPPLTVYAIPVGAVYASTVRAGAGACIRTVETIYDQGIYHMLGVAAGDYYVLVYPSPAAFWQTASSGRTSPGQARFGAAYTRAVQCGLQYGCDDHSLVQVTVHPGESVSGIDPNDWYAVPDPFPLVPTDVPGPTPLPAPPSAFLSAQAAAIYYAQIQTGTVYTAAGQGGCPVNRACVSLGPQHSGAASAYFVGTAGSNTDLQSCGFYVRMNGAGWHNVDARCTTLSEVFPAVGVVGFVRGGMGDTECVHIRVTPGRSGTVVGCLALGTSVTIDGGPSYVEDSDTSLGATDRLWWHVKGRGWMVHRYL